MTYPILRYTLAAAISLRLHPSTDCLRCQSTKTHHGAVFGYTHHIDAAVHRALFECGRSAA